MAEDHTPADGTAPITVGLSRGDRTFLLVVAPVVGGALGGALPFVADWASEQRWVPFGGPLKLAASWDGPWARAAFVLLGLLAGLAFVAVAVRESLQVTVDRDEVRWRRGGKTRRFPRQQVEAAYTDGKDLVLRRHDASELARDRHEGSADVLAAAFRAHGYDWQGDTGAG